MNFARLIAQVGSKMDRMLAVRFRGSKSYWDRRYALGGNSGAGSQSKLAQFKAEYVNKFVAHNRVESVIEYGCGDGRQLALARYPRYFGVDVSKTAIDLCRNLYAGDDSKVFGLSAPRGVSFDLALSLDVIYHLVEDEVFTGYMAQLFRNEHRWVIIYASNVSQEDFALSYPDPIAPHVKHRRFTDWISLHAPDWQLLDHAPNAYPFRADDPANSSFAEFFVYSRQGT